MNTWIWLVVGIVVVFVVLFLFMRTASAQDGVSKPAPRAGVGPSARSTSAGEVIPASWDPNEGTPALFGSAST